MGVSQFVPLDFFQKNKMAIKINPSDITAGLLKWGTTILAAYLMGHASFSSNTANWVAELLIGIVVSIATGVFTVLHRLKTARAQIALAEHPRPTPLLQLKM